METTTREDTPSRLGNYTHSRDCDRWHLGVAVEQLIETDYPVESSEIMARYMHAVVIGYRDSVVRDCHEGCGARALVRVKEQVRQARASQRHIFNPDCANRLADLIALRDAIRAEIGEF